MLHINFIYLYINVSRYVYRLLKFKPRNNKRSDCGVLVQVWPVALRLSSPGEGDTSSVLGRL